LVFVSDDKEMDIREFNFSNINSKIGNNDEFEKYMEKGIKIHIEDLIVNDEIRLEEKVITIN